MLKEIAATPVGDINLRKPAHTKPDMSLIEVVGKMRERRRGATIVEDHDGRLVGIFTENDLMLRVDHQSQDWYDKPVREFMTADPTTIAPGQSLSKALRAMKKGNFRHLPVVGEDGKTVGILSIRDILSHIVEHFPQEFINLPPDPDHEASRRWGG